MTDWTTVSVIVGAEDLDLAVGLAWEAGVSGIEERERPDGSVELRLGCETAVVPAVTGALEDRWAVRIEVVSSTEGLDAWRDHAEIRYAGPFVIVPAWMQVPGDVDGDDVLVIDPGHAFGSASHETTRLCLEIIGELVTPGTRVADIGCGSGILSVAAARRGAASIVAIDVVDEAVHATSMNADRNDVGQFVAASTTPVGELASASFDLILANIGAATLCSMAEELVRCLDDRGTLVLSGVLDEQVDIVVSAFSHVAVFEVEERVDGEWCALILRRR